MDLTSLVVRFALVVPAIVFHEVAHGYAALALGDTTAKDAHRLSLNPLKHIDPFGTVLLPLLMTATLGFGFGYAKPVPVNPWRFRGDRRVGMALTGIAGPGANLAMALVAAGVVRVLGGVSGALAEILWTAAYAFCMVNLALMFFNLIPIPPFDGSRLLLPFLSRRGLALYQDLERYGFVIVIALLMLPPQVFHVDLLGVYLDATLVPVLRLLTGVA
ncbi:site-2 protease family protein [Coriobacteriia bacterium Es71-Z0120]|jgi:Zn-dependent protease|uniref:site-2 protease family protein n=1 Tax=Parvivirga hydrogeniphila TaxID=2939460 RepID=UPI002260F5C9|nr:site-2 protease family protein [Parvivirga hydrogeniphila]MCL4079042.1 site-2 protease family protein [Parvivirga hydrogeniphila]